MTLAPGIRLGAYEIVAPLGSGGMGEVYRARDASLQRDVALKLLPYRFASDADRLARFQREAQVLASLNHPNIAQIYGLESAGTFRCIVMELVEGDTLEERLRRGPIAVDEALPIARQIAEALEAAHERGIIHRDLKPANIKLTPEGRVKVLDFGLAKALVNAPANEALSNSPTLSMAATQAGVILGTAAYMSPEQAKGKEADRKSEAL
jgi:serine/threonine protein kinase